MKRTKTRMLLTRAATLPPFVMAAILNGCTTGEGPQYQGKSGATPVIEDYYPSKTNQPAARPTSEHHAPPMSESKVAVPENTADIFRETEKHFQELAVAIQNKDARMGHHHDNAIRTLIAGIPQRARPDNKADSEARARDIADAARAAHRSAHQDEWGQASAHVKHGQASLAKLKTSFHEIAK